MRGGALQQQRNSPAEPKRNLLVPATPGCAEHHQSIKAEGRIQAICDLVRAGDLSRAIAMLRLQHLAEQGVASDLQVRAAIATLGNG